MAKISAEQYHGAADVVGAYDDAAALAEYGIEEEAIAEFVRSAVFGPREGGRIPVDRLTLALGLAIGVVARSLTDPCREALQRIRDYEESFGGPPPDDEMREIARKALA